MRPFPFSKALKLPASRRLGLCYASLTCLSLPRAGADSDHLCSFGFCHPQEQGQRFRLSPHPPS